MTNTKAYKVGFILGAMQTGEITRATAGMLFIGHLNDLQQIADHEESGCCGSGCVDCIDQ